MTIFQSKQDSKKGKGSKKEAQPVRKRGRPPSTDAKKEYAGEKLKTENIRFIQLLTQLFQQRNGKKKLRRSKNPITTAGLWFAKLKIRGPWKSLRNRITSSKIWASRWNLKVLNIEHLFFVGKQTSNKLFVSTGNTSMSNQMNFMPANANHPTSNTWINNYINHQNEMNNKKKISNNQIGVTSKNKSSYAGNQVNVGFIKSIFTITLTVLFVLLF